ncbi:MAG: hypothetical protein VB082_06445 [Christensenella sp.]|nr:hypothetical protein [Christensenella sp.]
MDKKEIGGSDGYLLEARLRSKQFYIKATQNTVETAHELASQCERSAEQALELLEKCKDSNDGDFAQEAVLKMKKAAQLSMLATKAMQEALEAAELVAGSKSLE